MTDNRQFDYRLPKIHFTAIQIIKRGDGKPKKKIKLKRVRIKNERIVMRNQEQENTNQTNNCNQISTFNLTNDDAERSKDDAGALSEDETALSADADLSAISTRDDAEIFLKAKGLDYSELEKEFNETGEISKESRKKLLQMGISNEFTDNYIEGQKARMNAELDEISQCIGGREKMDSVIKWAGNNLAKDEIRSINTICDKNVMKIILKELKTRMDEKEGIMPKYTKGEGNRVTSDKFRSKAEMYEAINNPKYRKDDAYRQDVRRKIMNSMNAGIDLGI